MTEVFSLTLQQMLGFFALMLTGFVLAKAKILPQETGKVLAKLETFVFMPALIFTTFAERCTVENIKKDWVYSVFGLFFLFVFVGAAFALSRVFFPKPEYRRKVYFYSFIISNYGFMGNALVEQMFGREALFHYMMFTQPFSIFVYAFAVAMFAPDSGAHRGFRWKNFVNPPLIALVCGAAAGLLPFSFTKEALPGFLSFLPTTLDSAAKCMSPVAMILAGFVIGTFSVRELLGDWKIYPASAIRLLALPAFAAALLWAVLRAVPLDGGTVSVLKRSLICFACMPTGLNAVTFPASFGEDTRPGAGIALVSTLLGLITIPLMFAVFGIGV